MDEREKRIGAIDPRKHERILNAAMAEFANGYKQASTDIVVREAGISKGLLYHYFGTKKALYLYLLRYAVRMMIDEYLSLINMDERDILERWRQTALLKVDLVKRHPDLFAFITRAFLEGDDEVAEDVEALKAEFYGELKPQIFDDVDVSRFREDIPPEVVKRMIMVLIQNLADEETAGKQKLSDFDGSYDAMLDRLDKHILYLRKCFYKDETIDGRSAW